MYVMSSFSSLDQSLAGSIFNSVTKLCTVIGLGITTTIYESTSHHQTGDAIRPYLATYWFAAAMAGASILLLPCLNLGTQGGEKIKTQQRSDDRLEAE